VNNRKYSSRNRRPRGTFRQRGNRRRWAQQTRGSDQPVAERAAEATLEALAIPTEWSQEAHAAVARLPSDVDGSRYPHREDLRLLPLVTIDGESARDFDDAVFAEHQLGGWRLVVAIADVAHYVQPESPLDQAAWQRGTSVYLPDRVIPVLPEALSNNLCSLRPQEQRLAIVCEMAVEKCGSIASYSFREAVIRSRQRMTYSQIAAFLNGEGSALESPIAHSIRTLAEVYQALRQARKRRGALDFDTPEGRLSLVDGAVEAISPVVRTDAHRLIEEAMIAANVCAAGFLMRHKRGALYRVHEAPVHEKAEQLAKPFAARGIPWIPDDKSPHALQGALAAIR